MCKDSYIPTERGRHWLKASLGSDMFLYSHRSRSFEIAGRKRRKHALGVKGMLVP